MALDASIHWGLILRVEVPQKITQEGWKWLLSEARFPSNFDGEIFGLHSVMQDQLRDFGFRGPEFGLEADFVDVDFGYRTVVNTVSWLQRIDVVPLIDSVKTFNAWKTKNSNVYTVENLDGRILTKGTEVDWLPLIGKIF
jgi:hypothetical protein